MTKQEKLIAALGLRWNIHSQCWQNELILPLVISDEALRYSPKSALFALDEAERALGHHIESLRQEIRGVLDDQGSTKEAQ